MDTLWSVLDTRSRVLDWRGSLRDKGGGRGWIRGGRGVLEARERMREYLPLLFDLLGLELILLLLRLRLLLFALPLTSSSSSFSCTSISFNINLVPSLLLNAAGAHYQARTTPMMSRVAIGTSLPPISPERKGTRVRLFFDPQRCSRL